MMWSSQIASTLHSDPVCSLQFAGIYASDDLPEMINKKPSLYVCNTDVAAGLGLHWIVFYFPDNEIAEFFDSLGHPPEHYSSHFETFLTKNSTSYKFQTKRLQGIGAGTCGQFCLFYAIHRCRGWTLKDVVSHFNWWLDNDQAVINLFGC